MKIDIKKSGDHYRADCTNLPGSPPVGIGKTPAEAMANLAWILLFSEDAGGKSPERWSKYVPRNERVTVTMRRVRKGGK